MTIYVKATARLEHITSSTTNNAICAQFTRLRHDCLNPPQDDLSIPLNVDYKLYLSLINNFYIIHNVFHMADNHRIDSK